jgi:hypothetical protein
VAGQNSTLFRKDVLGPPANASNAWSIVNGSLYMNALPVVTDKWFKNLTAFIRATDELWISWYGKLHAGPFNTACLQGHQHESPQKGKFCNCVTHPQPMPPPMSELA